ncbi:MAG: HlyD family efflux transporter periplasmic adaptor subunit [Candidatus Brocadiia bacterium]
MRHRRWRLGVLAVALAATARAGGAPEKQDDQPPTYTVQRGPFHVVVELDGVLEAAEASEVIFQLQAWSELTVRRAVEHGAHVKKGEVVLTLDTEKIDAAIRDIEAAQALEAVGIELAEAQLAALQETVPLDLQAAQRAKRIAEQDLERYKEIDRPLAVRLARFQLQSAEHYLEYEKEELRQLEKMYQADDLTEETEEIILKRQRRAVERAAFRLELARHENDQTLNVELPRKDVAIEENARRRAIAWQKAQETLRDALRKKKLELEKLRNDHQKGAEKLEKLKKDRQEMTVLAPADGIVYHGQCVRGTWSGLGRDLPPGTGLKPNQVVMTVVRPRPLFVRAQVPEAKLEDVRPGIPGQVAPTGASSLLLDAQVRRVSAVPVAMGKFEAILPIRPGEGAALLMPGMTCKARLVAYQQEDALVVPSKAVFADPLDPHETFVALHTADGGSRKQPVACGRKTEEQTEILDGLKEGDVVFLQKPGD